MNIPQEAIIELRQIHQNVTGEKLSESQTQAMAENMMSLLLAIYKPIPPKWLDEYNDGQDRMYHKHSPK